MIKISKFSAIQMMLDVKEMSTFDRAFVDSVDSTIVRLISFGKVSLDSLAAEFCISQSKLRRQIQNATGVTPAVYIMFVRMREAVHWLAMYPQDSISDIGQRCGFTDNAHFTHVFTRFFGCSPIQYVQKLNQH